MMNHGKAVVIKAMLVLPVVWIILTLFNDVRFLDSTIIGLGLLIISYIGGDLVTLPKTGNIVSTIADLVLAYIIVWGGLELLGYTDTVSNSLVTAVIVAAGEYLFHIWLFNNVYNNPNYSTHSGTINKTSAS